MSPKYPFLTYVQAAFQDWYNYSGLIFFGGLALITHNPGPLLVGAGLELAYLYTLATNSRFIRVVDSRMEDAKQMRVELLRDRLWEHIDPDLRTRYTELEQMTDRLRQEYSGLGKRLDPMQEDNYRKIVTLLASYLKIARAVTAYKSYLASVDPDQINKDITRLQGQLGEGVDPRVLDVRKKNIDVLQKRLEKITKAKANEDYLAAQMEAIEDTMRLVVDQAITLSDPKGTGVQIDNLLNTLQDTDLVSQEMSQYDELDQGMDDDVIDLPPDPRQKQKQ